VPTLAVIGAGAALLVLLHAVMAEGGALNLGHDIARFGLRRCILEFACGTTIAALWWRWRDMPRLPAWTSAGVSLLLMLLWAGGTLPETLAIPGAFAAALLAFALSSGGRGNPLDAGWLHYLGEISYATYLSHFMLFVLFKLALVSDAHAVPPLLIGLYLAMVLCASVALYHLVERPAQGWINGLDRATVLRIRSGKVSRVPRIHR
jgi:peptidoglycan/LPS O-acetylase OafA/YrhL